jgi:hypothetical protein
MIDINLKSLEEESKEAINLLDGLLINAMDVRDRILCTMSADDGEWALAGGIVDLAKRYRRLMREAKKIAEAQFDDGQWVIFALMTRIAERNKYVKLVPWGPQ